MCDGYDAHNFGLPIRQIEQLRQCEIITENEVKILCQKAREILAEESNVQKIDAPVTVSCEWSNPICVICEISGMGENTDS
jgi:hypothetical protein